MLDDTFQFIKATHWMGLEVADYDYYPPGIPCTHKGCLSHKTHPCECCGRIEGIGEAFIRNRFRIDENILWKKKNC
jgi:hypothetical protein